ncbi:gluconolaconase [Actinosynnema sp. ALI-1.44]|uniref:SMP-30/gluconolactonase/LRE family protein n=1 Tax=Actinosynnema sp. ALI-1.44 TaxID=1933779 RepID=UPI00097C5C43|nr:SMP-30/gluconolactonase/LRE family protein [Actinosynnema sp. ALI-1.44]ONI89910.1 gluconolaconase [Actinosynnema sp. ALI-1.44]
MSEPKVLLSGLGIPESGRWRDGRLWFCDWIAQRIVAVDPTGATEVVPAPVDRLMGWSIDWLPDGTLLTTGDKLRRVEPDGSTAVMTDQGANEIVVHSGSGAIYLNGADFDFAGGEAPRPGWIRLVRPDGEIRQVADDIQFPNGMVITPDGRTLIIAESFAGRLTAFDIDPDGGLSNRRVFADGLGPDGICLDGAGAVWTSTGANEVVRVAEGGEVLDRVTLDEDRAPFAMAIGGGNLFILTAEWRMAEGVAENLDRLTNGPRTGKVLVLPIE